MPPDPHQIARDLARALDPVELAIDCGLTPDPWQSELLRGEARKALLLCSRQAGKSTATALIALHEALYRAPAMILLVSPSQPQSGELFKKITGYWSKLPGAPEANQESLTRMELANGSRIVSLPGSEKTIRGYSGATLVVMDEASRVPDELLAAVRPMLATTDGRFFALTTPAGRRGWFFEQWTNGEGWERVEIPAAKVPRISPQFLDEERRHLGPLRYAQEYECAFIDDDTSAFSSALIEMALSNEFQPFI